MDTETLKTIKMLNTGHIERLTKDGLKNLVCDLNDYVNSLQSKLYEFTRLFSIKDYPYLGKMLIEFTRTLDSIGAKALADECHNFAVGLGHAKREVLESDLQKLQSGLITLSINIQTAGHITEAVKASAASTLTEEHKKTVLAVDDMPVVLQNLKAMVEGDYVFHGLSSGKGALNYLLKHEPDLIVLDIEMPEMDGYELFTQIRDLGHAAPIVFLTSNATQDCVMRAVKLGCAGFLAKPAQSELVRDKLRELLGC